jgi:hypothetical protein
MKEFGNESIHSNKSDDERQKELLEREVVMRDSFQEDDDEIKKIEKMYNSVIENNSINLISQRFSKD